MAKKELGPHVDCLQGTLALTVGGGGLAAVTGLPRDCQELPEAAQQELGGNMRRGNNGKETEETHMKMSKGER